jgi:DNA polymerase
MAKDRLGIDYETFATVSLPKVGVSRYTRHASAEVLMAAWSFNDVPQRQWVPAEGEPMPTMLRQALVSPDVEKWAWNSAFEVNATQNILGIPMDIRQWRDTMVLALSCSLPGKLEKAGPVVDLGEDKQKAAKGTRLIKKFSGPRKPTKNNPSTRVHWFDDLPDWEEYKDYNRQDEVAERAIYHKLIGYNMPDHEWDMWHIDQDINQEGLPINRAMMRNAITIYETLVRQRLEEMKELTGLENPNSGAQLLPWLQEYGYPFDDLKGGHIDRAIEREIEETGDTPNNILLTVLRLRAEVSRTSPKKFHALQRATDDDGRLRYAFQFAGAARTWRWAGRIYQPQNLPRPTKMLEKGIITHAKNVEFLDAESIDLIYGDGSMDLLASCIRPVVQAPPGYTFVDVDLNAIENRVLGWLADCPKILDVFRKGLDPYLAFAVYMYGIPYHELEQQYKNGDGSRRTIAKPGVLGCGYMLGAGDVKINYKTGEKEGTGLLGYAWNMGVKQFTKDESQLSVDTFRREFEEVTDYWYGIENAAKQCIRQNKEVVFGHISFDRKGPFMRMNLPSGRSLHYLRPRLEETMMPWGKKKMSITYEGQNDKKMWTRQSTHPGKLTENADQAISRDLLAHGIKLARKEGIRIPLHVHDQIVGLVKEDFAEERLATLKECMSDVPRWAPKLPLGVAGHITPIFIKD